MIDENYNVIYNNYSWNNVSNMIYIDQPTQVGFSYSVPVNGYIDQDTGYTVTVPGNVCPDYANGPCGTYDNGNYSETQNSTPSAAPNVWATLQGFMGAFPQYSRNTTHLATESYGGHYGPTFAEYFETQNAAKIAGAHNINLQSLSVGNGWYDPVLQYPSYYNYTVTPGNTYNYKPYNTSVAEEVYNLFYGSGNCVDQLKACNANPTPDVCGAADNFCYAVEDIFDTVTGRDEYDIRELQPDPFPPTFFVEYLNQPNVQQALGAYVNFSYSVTNLGAGTVATAFTYTGDDARHYSIIPDNQELLAQGVQILQYAGDADYNCNWLGGQMVAAEINATGWTSAGYQNISTSDGIVHGVVKQAGNYSFVRVYDAGHSVPFYKPLAALTMFQRLINGLDIATGKVKTTAAYRSTGPANSTYVNGGSTIQYEVVDPSCTYNTVTNEPNCPAGVSEGTVSEGTASSSTANNSSYSKMKKRVSKVYY